MPGDWTLPNIPNDGHDMKMSDWINIWQEWANNMMRDGVDFREFPRIAREGGLTFPKNLMAAIASKNTLFPDENQGYEYDLTNHMRRSFPHKNAEYPEGTGPGEWESMTPGELQSANAYYAWREDPRNFALIDGKFGGNPFNAWMATVNGRNNSGARSAGIAPGSTLASNNSSNTAGFGNVQPHFADKPTATSVSDAGTAVAHGKGIAPRGPMPPIRGTSDPTGFGVVPITAVAGGDTRFTDTTRKSELWPEARMKGEMWPDARMSTGLGANPSATQALTNTISGMGSPILGQANPAASTSGFGGGPSSQPAVRASLTAPVAARPTPVVPAPRPIQRKPAGLYSGSNAPSSSGFGY